MDRIDYIYEMARDREREARAWDDLLRDVERAEESAARDEIARRQEILDSLDDQIHHVSASSADMVRIAALRIEIEFAEIRLARVLCGDYRRAVMARTHDLDTIVGYRRRLKEEKMGY